MDASGAGVNAKPYALLMAAWVANMTHAGTDREIPLTAACVAILKTALAQVKALDGDRAAWIACDYCDETGIYSTPATAVDMAKPDFLDNEDAGCIARGICYRCRGKGAQSPADVKRNSGYQSIRRQSLAYA